MSYNNASYTEEWKRPFTNKRYIHPPLAENMFTMWPDMMIICGDIIEESWNYYSSGFRILVGEDMTPPDFAAVQYYTRDDGIPVHALSQNMGDFTIHMESLCNVCRRPTAFTEFVLTNNTNRTVSDSVCILPRSGNEHKLEGTRVDAYEHYCNNVYLWGRLHSNWKFSGDLLSDGDYSIRLNLPNDISAHWQGDIDATWYKRHTLRLDFTLLPGQRIAFSCGFAHGDVAAFDYGEERKKTVAFWTGELNRIKKYPGGAAYRPLVNNLVAQCLQMFAYPVGKDYVLPRQGGLQRVIWPCEGMEFLIALDRIGDFFDYTETAYETYFFTLGCKEGEDIGAVQNLSGQRWGSITGGSCYGCGQHLVLKNSKESFEKFADALYAGFNWMQRQRQKSMDGQFAGVGLFPPMKACDWEQVGQSILTDSINLEGYRSLAEAFEHFSDPRAAEIRAAYNDYMACMRKAVENEIAQNTRTNEMLLTHMLGVEMPDPPMGPYLGDGPAILVWAKVLEPGCEAIQLVENYYRNRGMMKNGLTGLMVDGLSYDPWAGHTWYTSWPDRNWFYNWLHSGQREKAAETLFAQMHYGMSPEYLLLERYADNDPYWTPWMPNASANGRLLTMLYDFYG